MKLAINGTLYEIEAIFKPSNRNTYIKFKDNMFFITSPYILTDSDILDLYNQNKQAFLNLIKKVDKKQIGKSNTVHIFGKVYNINIIESNRDYCEIDNDTLNIYTSSNEQYQIEYTFKLFLATLLNNYIKSIEDEAFNDFKGIVKQKPHIVYKDVDTYFGKCYFLRNEIYLNIKLARFDKLYIKSVLYHEYCHFKYHNHQAEFYYLYELKFPNAQKIQHALRQIKYNDLY